MENTGNSLVNGEKCERWEGCLERAKKHFKIADHMAYVTFSLLKENRLMMKIVSEIAKSVSELIKAFLYYEYSYKRVKLYRDAQRNLKTFIEKIALRYINKEDLKKIIRVLEIEKKHKDAPVEFVRKDKFVILLGDRYETLTIDVVKEFLSTARVFLSKFPEQGI